MADERPFTIGRSPDCDVVLADPSISRLHAEVIVLADGRVFVTDRRSTNGTVLVHAGAAESVRQAYAAPGDELRFGDVTVPVRELLEQLRDRVARADPGWPAPAPAPRPDPGARAVRCRHCGAVKAAASACPECGR